VTYHFLVDEKIHATGIAWSLPPACENDLYLFGYELPSEPARPISDYDFQVIQLPLSRPKADV